MISKKQTIAGLSLALLASSSALPARASIFGKKKDASQQGMKLTADQNRLIDLTIAREKFVIKTLKERAPLVETYIQNMRPDPVLLQVPESDEHFLGRVEFSKVINDQTYESGPKGDAKGGKFSSMMKKPASFFTGINSSLHLQFHESGFVQMLLMDSKDFDRQHYTFSFVRKDFLGTVPTTVFDVLPVGGKNARGRFFGRIWVESRTGDVIRFNGDFAGSEVEHQEYFHFDSWRTNVQPDLWLPTSFYVEESDPKSKSGTLKFKAINYVWGYALKAPAHDAENTSLDVVGAVDESQNSPDVSPLGAQRAFVREAEDNIVDRLTRAGLLAAPSDFDKTMEALANNILAYNNIPIGSPIHVRTMMTEPLESLAIGNTLIFSKSLIDTTAVITTDGAQQMGNLNAIIAFELAHVILGHRLDTKYAFNDRLLFPDNTTFKRFNMHHTAADNTEAAKKAIELLNVKELVDGQKYFGLYLQQLQTQVKALKTLNEPLIGDGLVKSDTDSTFWLAALMAKGPKLDAKDVKQQAAMPLNGFLRFDPWSDQIIQMHTGAEPILNARDKMAFEVAPLAGTRPTFYKAPAMPTAAPAPAPADPNATPAPAAPAPATAPVTAAPTQP